MSVAIKMREDYSADELRDLARSCQDGAQVRRLMSLTAVAEGKSRSEAAAIGLMDRQTLRDWVIRFNEDGSEGLIDHKSPGRKPKLSDKQKSQLAQLVKSSPGDYVPGLIRWRCIDLVAQVRELFGVDYHPATIARLLHTMGYSYISARPKHPKQDKEAIETYKNSFDEILSGALGDVPDNTPIEIWFQDEARVGQKNGQVYQWAEMGTRPSQPNDQRYASCYIFGAVCPDRDKGVALVMPYADTQAMQCHLDEISMNVATGAHGAVLMDGAGWHKSQDLIIPDNLSILFIPPYSPELNPVENIWQFLRQNYASPSIV